MTHKHNGHKPEVLADAEVDQQVANALHGFFPQYTLHLQPGTTLKELAPFQKPGAALQDGTLVDFVRWRLQEAVRLSETADDTGLTFFSSKEQHDIFPNGLKTTVHEISLGVRRSLQERKKR